jgi:hypothetical protein
LSDTQPATWPSPKIVAAAAGMRGAEVRVLRGTRVRVVKSSDPEVVAAVGQTGRFAACCERCGAAENQPAEPKGTNGPLVYPGTVAHATFLLTWLTAFSRAHASCPARA